MSSPLPISMYVYVYEGVYMCDSESKTESKRERVREKRERERERREREREKRERESKGPFSLPSCVLLLVPYFCRPISTPWAMWSISNAHPYSSDHLLANSHQAKPLP
ncbi:hypothetical protein BsWGS_16806 [Bradybaena similaris]